jgi:uncharacterized protein YrrD
MPSASHLMNRPVLDIATGGQAGTVSGVLVDPSLRRVTAFRVNRGLLHHERFVRWTDLQGTGPDALTIRNEDSLLHRADVDANHTALDTLQGRPVITEGGERLGEVTDYGIDEGSGLLTGFEVRPDDAHKGLFGRSENGNFTVPVDQVVTLGSQSVVVRTAAREIPHGDSEAMRASV